MGYCNWRPIPVIKIVKYCGVGVGGGEGGIGGAKILQKIMAPPLSVIKIVKYCGVGGGGGAKILQKIMAPPLSVIKIVKYCGVAGGGALGSLKSYKDNGAPSLSLRLLSIVASGEGEHCGAPKSYKR